MKIKFCMIEQPWSMKVVDGLPPSIQRYNWMQCGRYVCIRVCVYICLAVCACQRLPIGCYFVSSCNMARDALWLDANFSACWFHFLLKRENIICRLQLLAMQLAGRWQHLWNQILMQWNVEWSLIREIELLSSVSICFVLWLERTTYFVALPRPGCLIVPHYKGHKGCSLEDAKVQCDS